LFPHWAELGALNRRWFEKQVGLEFFTFSEGANNHSAHCDAGNPGCETGFGGFTTGRFFQPLIDANERQSPEAKSESRFSFA